MVALDSDGHFIRFFCNRDLSGNESVALRSSRGRTGTRGRVSHGIFVDEVRAFFFGEYAAMITGSAGILTLFLGGWHLPLPSWRGGFHWAVVDGTGTGWPRGFGGLVKFATVF